MKPTILFSSRVSASNNIATNLIDLGFKPVGDSQWIYDSIDLIDTKVDHILNISTNVEGDYIIVLSPHRSKAKLPALTTHIPGNWTSADFGGKPFTLNIALPSVKIEILKALFRHGRDLVSNGWSVSYEVDHHGPTIEKPIIFVEIGSGEEEWINNEAGFAVASAVFDVVNMELDGKIRRRPSFFGIGGGHYAPKFTRLALNNDMPFGHMLPKYKVDSITLDVFKQAIYKSIDPVDSIVVEKKGINARQRDIVLNMADEVGVKVVKM